MFEKAKKKKKYLKIMVYGASGNGKTHFSLTFPKTAVIDTESGSDYFADRFEFDVLHTKSYRDVKDAVSHLKTHGDKYETLVIDGITGIYDNLKAAAQKFVEDRATSRNINADNAGLTPLEWGRIKLRFKSMMTDLYNMPCHIVITAWEKPLYEDVSKNELKQIGLTFDADRCVAYQPDIVMRLVVDKSGKRYGIIEKDRTGTFKKMQRIDSPSFEDFAPIIEKHNGGEWTKLQSDDEAILKDSNEFVPRQADLEYWKKVFWREYKKFGFEPDDRKEVFEFMRNITGKEPSEHTVADYLRLIEELNEKQGEALAS